LRPDRNTWIRSKDVWGEADVRKLAADVAHGLKGDDSVGLSLSRIAEDQVEGDADAAKLCFACSLIHLVDALMTLVHEL